jgi:hypothetical protein
MALDNLQPKFLHVHKIFQACFVTHTGNKMLHERVSTCTCFSRQQELGLFVGYDIVLCYRRGRQPIGRKFKVQEKRVRKYMKTNSRFYHIRVSHFVLERSKTISADSPHPL